MNFSSMSLSGPSRALALTCYPQRIFLQGPSECRQLHAWETHWKRLLWQGLSRVAQTHQWLESKVRNHKGSNGADTRQVVLKSSSKEDTNLVREIHHHRQFLHPHIARLYEVVVTESLVWLALEYCPGRCAADARNESH